MIRVLIVDDSAVVRTTLSDILNAEPDIEVVGVASDPFFARDKVKKLDPDVITLDIEMPRMDGLTFLRKLMAFKPLPVVMVSSLTQRGADVTLQALSAGAVDFIAKPSGSMGFGLDQIGEELADKVRAAAAAGPRLARRHRARRDATRTPAARSVVDSLRDQRTVSIDSYLGARQAARSAGTPVICIGASTGGTVAIEHILTRLPKTLPGIVIVQHMPPGFTASFARRLNEICEIEVVEGVDGMTVEGGRAIIAPGDLQMLLQRRGSRHYVEVREAPRVNRHRPSVDVLFRSAANATGKDVVAALLTGMGADGARGLKDLFDSGAYTIAQDEESSVVFGMPREGIRLGGARRVAPLDDIAALLMAAFEKK